MPKQVEQKLEIFEKGKNTNIITTVTEKWSFRIVQKRNYLLRKVFTVINGVPFLN